MAKSNNCFTDMRSTRKNEFIINCTVKYIVPIGNH